MAEYKVQFNLCNAHYAVLTDTVSTSGVHSYSYGTPKPIPGAVTLTLDAAGDTSTFYADGMAYYQTQANNGYSGTLTIADVPQTFAEQILKQIKDVISVSRLDLLQSCLMDLTTHLKRTWLSLQS